MRENAALITGGTGFIGGRLLRRLLELDRFDKIYVLMRRGRNSSVSISAEERAATVFADIPKEKQKKIVVLEGDVTQENCGLTHGLLLLLEHEASALECFHTAADIRFGEENRDDIFKTNCTGTSNLLWLLATLGVRRLHYVSTAYVCGDRKGFLLEGELDKKQNFRNPYEESKFQAELWVWNFATRQGIPTTVYRPSIVVGDSVTGVTGSFAGYYAYMRGFALLRREIVRALEQQPEEYHQEGIYLRDEKLHLPLVIWGNPQAEINIVCIDYVTNLIARLAFSSLASGLTFHIVNPRPPEAQWLLRASLGALNIVGTHLLDTLDNLQTLKRLITKTPIIDSLEKRIHGNVRKYVDYSEVGPDFSMANVERVLGKIPEHPAVNTELIRRLLLYAADHNFGKTGKRG